MTDTYRAHNWPKAGEVWRFPVDATPGSQADADKRWVDVLVPPGQERRLFAARAELLIPGAAPMTCVEDLTPVVITRWYDGGEYDPGYYDTGYLPPRLIRDAWGRDPAQAATASASAESRAKAGVSWANIKARYPNVPAYSPLAAALTARARAVGG